MSKYINIASVQFDMDYVTHGSPEAPAKTLEQIQCNMDTLAGQDIDLVVFAEGVESFGTPVDKAESFDNPGPFLQCYREFALKEQCHVAGSIKFKNDGAIYNSVVIISPQGDFLGVYHKTALTQGEVEMGLTPGKGAVIIDTEIGRIGGVICFDLNFPALRQQYRELQPDILVFPSMYHGGLMQDSWAYECQAFFVGAVQFHGAGIRDPFGRVIDETDCHHEIAVARVNIDRVMMHLDKNQDKMPDIKKKYKHMLHFDTPKNIACTILYSESEEFSAIDIVKEYDLELREDYFSRSLEACEGSVLSNTSN